jgi:hypothetical protein
MPDKREGAQYDRRWRAARARLEAAADAEGLHATIVSIENFDFTAQFTFGNKTWMSPALHDIAILEDDPSPALNALLERAKRELY